ncbi:hypothetical protein Tco_0145236 [Tanacetum coccineum]
MKFLAFYCIGPSVCSFVSVDSSIFDVCATLCSELCDLSLKAGVIFEYGYVKYRKKTVKNGQKRTRERMSDQEAKEIKAEAREIMPQPSTVNCS